MLFRKKIEPLCSYCTYGEAIDEESMVCRKKGVVSPWQSCKRFSYDPLKREPEIQLQPLTEVDEEAFSGIINENSEDLGKSLETEND